MSVRLFATLFGIVFLVAGAAGFVPGLSPTHIHPGVSVTAASRLALGLFPVNILHNLVHLAFGLWGILAARSVAASFGYAKGVAVIYAVLTVMGLIPVTATTFGLVPLYGNDIWLHALLALVAGYFGFVHREHVVDSTLR
ncbi:DUF4383 domain-containing protein [Sphingomonas fuzhouensis]|uniref:DUF4383 domain-containing protein n=1 Tax=Sphingomonas fuzhouensis TaxID=3106033 RepID=UPI002AFF04F8|nr:DUF4383 domain-containing protein [Sphingomonas sp. SGZ-02]